ncbi:O-Antigen ligase [Dialister histaminiformans]|uniref:O-Antigen ligase n=1 Tax=Allisonella histaminiformans TaxID=209880 RepID=A0A1G5VB42_9FIRM|nr:O-antigen ligase family protein [Allisonella histaminiformans]SDA42616.1 O-Antigen ligase [Allisonella histaminiformans]
MEKQKNLIFGVIVFTLIFCYIPTALQLNFLAGTWATKLTIYPIIIAMVFTLFYRKSFSLSRDERKMLIRYLVVYFFVMIISLVWGLVDYPYYNVILQGPVNQIKKLPSVYSFLINHDISVTKQGLLFVWMLARPIKALFVDIFWGLSLSVLVYVWYKNDFHNGLRFFLKGVIASVIVVVLYGFLDAMYLSGSELATDILIILNPIVHEIKEEGIWWPPILWNGQLRSLFAEPSYYGIFVAFALPWIWYVLDTSRNMRNRLFLWGILFFLILFLFLTRARTANVLLLAEVVLLFLFTISGFLQSRRFFLSVFLCVLLAFGTSLVLFNYGFGKNSNNMTALSYMQDNIGSLTSVDKRSNRSRYSVMIADLKIGMEHPVLGVGPHLRNAYIPHYLPDKEHLSNETKNWIKNQDEKGILRAGFPELGEYTSRFAETGILGLLVFMLPSFYLIWRIIIFLKIHRKDMPQIRAITVYFLISFLGVLATGIGDSLHVLFSYWLLLGLGFTLLHYITIESDEKK